MPKREPHSLGPFRGHFLHDLSLRARLILRLLVDPRVSPWLKLLPFGSILYLIFPDLAPGPVDDAALIWLGFYLFVELCPSEIVQEHLEALSGNVIPGEWRDVEEAAGELTGQEHPEDE